MPTCKETPAESGDSRVATRAANANKHPGTEAVDALRVKTRCDPQVIQAEKEKKKVAKEVKERAQQAEVTRKEAAQKDLDEFQAQQATNLKVDTAPRQQSKGINLLFWHLESNIGS